MRSAGGVLLQVAGMPGGTVKNELVLSVTRGSYAFIDSMRHHGDDAEPLTSAYLTTILFETVSLAGEDNTWTTGDTLTIYSPPNVNLKYWTPVGADVSVGGNPSAGWIQFVSIPDTSSLEHRSTSL